MCAKIIHATSISRGPNVAISQSRTATGRKSSYSTLPTRESPQHEYRLGRGDVLGPVRLQPLEGLLDKSRPADVGHRERHTTPSASPSCAAARFPRSRRRGIRRSARAWGIECSFASTSTVSSCSSRCDSAGESANQLPPNVYGITSGGTMPDDVVHQEELRAQHGARRLEPPHPRHRNIGQLADLPDHLELLVHPVRREHRHVLGGRRDPRHPLLLVPSTVGLPASGQDDGLRRHPVGVDAALDGHVRFRAVRA